jgi:tetratricopeptide (TPR) repeat protein
MMSLRLIAVLAFLNCVSAHADEYADVSQLVRVGKLAEAMSRVDQFLATKPKDPQMRFIKGVIQRDTGKANEAIATFTKLTEDYPELPEPYNNLAVLYASQSQFEKARKSLESAISTNPSYATAHENLGDIYARMASQAYNNALQLDKSNPAVPPKLALIKEIFNAGVARVNVATASSPVSGTPASPAPAAPPPVKQPPTVAAAPIPVPPVAPPVPKPAPTPVSQAPVSPPIPTTPPPAAPPASEGAAVADVEAAVAAWARAWSARDVKAYLAAYGKDFDPPGSMGRKAWEEERQQRISSKASITVKVEKLNVNVNGTRAVAKFLQDYKAGGLAVSSHKTLDFSKVGDRWQIVKETVGN